ncbi:class I SAM-dependent methyltransferase [Streptomyces sp. NPDC059740]|uniref:class I SAM-dependent methyltransferase n=1 Tax=Streptomyces sp. NPDC059740 TaxID=3346926 RepID=UPI0036623557
MGAGTGIATRLLQARGARVTAVEPGPAMAAELLTAGPGTPLVRAVGDALPFRGSAGFDYVTYAQAWHWTGPARSVPEALRVLRPGGAFAAWWNVPDTARDWVEAQEQRLEERLPGYRRHGRPREAPDLIRRHTVRGAEPVVRELHWVRHVPVEVHLAMLGSRSRTAVEGPRRAAELLREERAALHEVFPDGIVEEPWSVLLTVTLNPW